MTCTHARPVYRGSTACQRLQINIILLVLYTFHTEIIQIKDSYFIIQPVTTSPVMTCMG